MARERSRTVNNRQGTGETLVVCVRVVSAPRLPHLTFKQREESPRPTRGNTLVSTMRLPPTSVAEGTRVVPTTHACVAPAAAARLPGTLSHHRPAPTAIDNWCGHRGAEGRRAEVAGAEAARAADDTCVWSTAVVRRHAMLQCVAKSLLDPCRCRGGWVQ